MAARVGSGAPTSGRKGWIWLVYAGLYGLSIPWYLPSGGHPAIWLGLPHWVVLSLLATAATAGFTAFVVWRRWPEADDDWDLGPAPRRGEVVVRDEDAQVPR